MSAKCTQSQVADLVFVMCKDMGKDQSVLWGPTGNVALSAQLSSSRTNASPRRFHPDYLTGAPARIYRENAVKTLRTESHHASWFKAGTIRTCLEFAYESVPLTNAGNISRKWLWLGNITKGSDRVDTIAPRVVAEGGLRDKCRCAWRIDRAWCICGLLWWRCKLHPDAPHMSGHHEPSPADTKLLRPHKNQQQTARRQHKMLGNLRHKRQRAACGSHEGFHERNSSF